MNKDQSHMSPLTQCQSLPAKHPVASVPNARRSETPRDQRKYDENAAGYFLSSSVERRRPRMESFLHALSVLSVRSSVRLHLLTYKSTPLIIHSVVASLLPRPPLQYRQAARRQDKRGGWVGVWGVRQCDDKGPVLRRFRRKR